MYLNQNWFQMPKQLPNHFLKLASGLELIEEFKKSTDALELESNLHFVIP